MRPNLIEIVQHSDHRAALAVPTLHNLEEIARKRPQRILFVALPLRLTGATGSPIRPVAIA